MGVVYEARQISLDKRVALKILPLAVAMNPKNLQRFKSEAKAAAQLDHPNIVPVHAFGSERGVYFYAMHFVDGSNLAEVIRDLRRTVVEKRKPMGDVAQAVDDASQDPNATQPMANASTVRSSLESTSGKLLDFKSYEHSRTNSDYHTHVIDLCIQVAQALQHAHESGVVHRDIKPSNLMLDFQGKIWLTDFGLALRDGKSSLTGPGDMVGTLRYMSPEQVLGLRVVIDYRTDIYSLGATIYELLTLTPACPGNSRQEIVRQISLDDAIPMRKVDRRIPRELEIIVGKAMAKNPDDRYSSAQELANDLRRHRSNEPIFARPPTMAERVGKWAWRHQSLMATSVGSAAVILIAALAISWMLGVMLAQEMNTNTKLAEEVRRYNGQRLAAISALNVATNPGLAMALALDGRKLHDCPETRAALQQAYDANHELATFQAHPSGVGSVACSPDGKTIVTTGTRSSSRVSSEPAKVWDIDSKSQRATLLGSEGVTSVAFSPVGGRVLAAASPFGSEKKKGESAEIVGTPPVIFDAASGRRLLELKDAYLFEATARCFSADGRFVVVPIRGGKARVLDVIEGLTYRDLVGHTDRINSAHFSPSGKYVVTASHDNTIRIWNIDSGMAVMQIPFPPQIGRASIEFDRSEQLLAVNAGNGVQVWRVPEGKKLGEITDIANRVLFTADRLLVWKSVGNSLHTFDPHNLARIQTLELETNGTVSVDSANGLIAVGCDRTISMFDELSGKLVASLRGHDGNISAIQFVKSASQLVSASFDGTARVWHTLSGAERSQFAVRSKAQSGRLAKVDNQRFAYASQPQAQVQIADVKQTSDSAPTQTNQTKLLGDLVSGLRSTDVAWTQAGANLCSWNLTTRETTDKISLNTTKISYTRCSENGEKLVVLGETGRAWLISRRGSVQELIPNQAPLRFATISNDGNRVATNDGGGKIAIWDTANGSVINTFDADLAGTYLEFNDSATRLLALSNDRRLSIWDTITGTLLAKIVDPVKRFDTVRFCLNGESVATWDRFNCRAVDCWNATDGKWLGELTQATGRVNLVASPTNPEVLISSTERGLWLWNYQTLQSQQISSTPMACAEFSPDASRIVCATFMPQAKDDILSDKLVPSYSPCSIQVYASQAPFPMLASILSNDSYVTTLNVLADGRILAASQFFGAIVANVAAPQITSSTLGGHSSPIAMISADSAGKIICTASWDSSIGLWDSTSGKLLHRLHGHSTPVHSIAFSQDGGLLISGGGKGEGILWDVAQGKLLHRLVGHTGAIWNTAFLNAQDCDHCSITNADDGTIRVWNSAGRTVHVLTSLLGNLSGLEVSGSQLLTSPDAKADSVQLNLLNESTRPNELRSLSSASSVGMQSVNYFRTFDAKAIQLEHSNTPVIAKFSTGGKQAVTVDQSGVVTLWRIDSQPNQPVRIDHLQKPIRKVIFSSDDRLLVVVHANQISALDTQSGKLVGSLALGAKDTGKSMPNELLVISNDQWCVYADTEGIVRRWPLDPLTQAQEEVPRSLTPRERSLYHVPAEVLPTEAR